MKFLIKPALWSSPGSEKVVHRLNMFITSSLAFGCRGGCHRRIFVAGLLFLYTAVLGKVVLHRQN